MFDESHRGHLRFWFSEFVEVVVVVAAVAVEVAVEEGDGEEGREVGDGVGGSRTPPLMEIFLSPAMKLEPPNSSWIIFLYFCGSTTIQKHEKQKGGDW